MGSCKCRSPNLPGSVVFHHHSDTDAGLFARMMIYATGFAKPCGLSIRGREWKLHEYLLDIQILRGGEIPVVDSF